MSTPTPTPPRETKKALVRKLLTRKAGADIDTLRGATGWQAHTVRAALSRFRKAGYKVERSAPKGEESLAVYRITASPEARP